VTKTSDPPSIPLHKTETVTGVKSVLAATLRRPGLVRIFPRDPAKGAQTWALGKGGLLIGRAAESGVWLEDASVSRQHARLELSGDGARVTDLGSRHGTFVEGQQVGSAAESVAYGSIIRAGKNILLLVEDIEPYAQPPHSITASFLGTRRGVVGGPALVQAWRQAQQVAALTQPVLVRGESGSGKEAVARLVHAHREKRGPFVAINIAAVPEGLFESELFGHVKGAFTGASHHHAGAFREASGGVLFLDEVGDLRADLQPKLLRAIDQMRVRPVGAKEDVPVDVRVVAATSQDLHELCAQGRFRLDLYYRLAGIIIHVPPLRERRDETMMLAQSLLASEHPDLELTAAAAEALCLARWEGNVRQLHHALTHAAVQAMASSRASGLHEAASEAKPADQRLRILPEHLPAQSLAAGERSNTPTDSDAIRQALVRANGNASHAAKLLGISRATLYNILKREGVDPAELRVR
jgi:DNA-binding NtrC family response regulator